MTLSQTNFESMDVPNSATHPFTSPSPLGSRLSPAVYSPLGRSGRVAYTSHPSVRRAESHLNRVRDSHTEQLRNIAFYLDVANMMEGKIRPLSY